MEELVTKRKKREKFYLLQRRFCIDLEWEKKKRSSIVIVDIRNEREIKDYWKLLF
jgi:hypothetical protein